MQIKEVMQTNLVTLAPNASLVDAASKMRASDVGCLLIARDGQLEGILTDRDLVISAIADGKDPRSTRVSEVMHTDVVTASADTDLKDAALLMAQPKVRRLPIQSNGRLEGLISVSDLSHVLREELDAFFSLQESDYHFH